MTRQAYHAPPAGPGQSDGPEREKGPGPSGHPTRGSSRHGCTKRISRNTPIRGVSDFRERRSAPPPALLKVLVMLVVLAPLPFAAVLPWTWSLMGTLVGSMVLWWCVQALHRPEQVVGPSSTWPFVVPFLLASLWIAMQTAGFVPDPWKHPLWSASGATLDSYIEGAISINPYGTGSAATKLLTYAGIFWLALQTCRSRRAARFVLHAIALAGLAYATYGIIAFFAGNTKILWFDKWAYTDAVTSTFVNRNNYAAYAGTGLIVTSGLILSCVTSLGLGELPPHERLRRLVLGLAGRNWHLLLGFVVLTTSLLLTQSRAGLFSTLCGLIILLTLLTCGTKVAGKAALYSSLSLTVTAGLLFLIGGEGVLDRLMDAPDQAEIRLNTYRLTFEGLAERPLLGTGYGTFEEAFQLIRDDTVVGTYEMAHNTYLELMFELGWLNASVVSLIVVATTTLIVIGLRSGNRHSLLLSVASAITVQLSLHSIVDFSLQIPAVAAQFSLILGASTRHACEQVRCGDTQTRSQM